MYDKFFNKENVEYFWEYNYSFAEYFLKKIFGDKFKRKYAINDDGIFNLIYMDNKIYHIKLTAATKMVENDNYLTTDKTKNEIVAEIVKSLPENTTINRGKYITFKLGNYIAKIEVIKKLREPS